MVSLFLTLLDMSITASYVILAILIMRLLLKKAPKKYSYALWAVAGFRLVCPISFQSVLSLFNLTQPQAATARQEVFEQIEAYSNLPKAQAYIGLGNRDYTYPVINFAEDPNSMAKLEFLQDYTKLLPILWLTGIAVLVIISIINSLRLRHTLRFATRLEKGIWQCEAVRSPFILGILFPRIYLPYGLDEQTGAYILAHEKHHLKRFDHVIKLLSFAILAVHWFNPLCHLAFYLMNRDMEMSCDEYVLARMGVNSTDYAQTLLSIASNKRFPAPTPLAFGETGVAQRIKNILSWKKPTVWITVISLILTATLLICCAADPKETPQLPSPLGQQYETESTVYESPLYSTTMVGTCLQFAVSSDGTLSQQIGNDQTTIGQLEPVAPLTESTLFDSLFRAMGWKEQITASTLRRKNADVWVHTKRVNMVSTDVYALIQQKDGTLYLLCGTYSESSPMFRLYRLQPAAEKTAENTTEFITDSVDRGSTQWIFDPTSSESDCQYFPLKFFMQGTPYTHIEMRCSFGTLLDMDSSVDNTITPTGQFLTFPADHSIYWYPPITPASGTLSFRIYNDDTLLYFGTLSLSGDADINSSTTKYTITLREGTNLILSTDIWDNAEITLATKTQQTHDYDDFINQVLLSKYPYDLPSGDLATFSHQLYFTQQLGSSDKTVYLSAMAMHRQFTRTTHGITATQLETFPVYIIAQQDANGILSLVDCGFSNDEIPTAYENSPSALDDSVPSSEPLFLRLSQQCYANAALWIKDTDPMVEDLLNQICASPAQASSPGAYIDAHWEEYNTLLYLGEHTLSYCFRQFASGGSAGLSGHIMALVCEETMQCLGEAFLCDYGNGTEWFSQFKAQAISLRDQGVDLNLYPASKLLLSLLPDSIE